MKSPTELATKGDCPTFVNFGGPGFFPGNVVKWPHYVQLNATPNPIANVIVLKWPLATNFGYSMAGLVFGAINTHVYVVLQDPCLLCNMDSISAPPHPDAGQSLAHVHGASAVCVGIAEQCMAHVLILMTNNRQCPILMKLHQCVMIKPVVRDKNAIF